MNMLKIVATIVFTLVLVTGCGVVDQPVKNYCDSEVSYDLWKRESGYRLHLRVGTAARPQACRINSDAPRMINLDQDVASLEEADKLIEQYRQKHAETVAAAKLAQAREGTPAKP